MPWIDLSIFNGNSATEFREQNCNARELILDGAPKARGRFVKTIAFVDASQAPDKKTRRSHTGFTIFINRAPVVFYSKRQATVKLNIFSSEFIALKTCAGHIVGLQLKI